MPRVSDQHLAMRRNQVLDAASRCFARQGFSATSIDDVIRESGLSAGAVYRYFDGKDDLIAASAEQALTRASAALHWAREAPEPVSPREALHALFTQIAQEPQPGQVDPARVAVGAWAEALRNPRVKEVVETTFRTVREDLLAVLTRWRDAGHLDPQADLDAAAKAMFGTVPGFLLQRMALGDVDAERYLDGLAVFSTDW